MTTNIKNGTNLASETRNQLTVTEKWCYFFRYAPETTSDDLRQLTGKDVIIQEAYEVLDRFGWSDEELLIYEGEIKRQMDEEAIERQKLVDAEEKGIEKGKKENMVEVAIKMLAKNKPIEEIAEFTGLSAEEILKLREEYEKNRERVLHLSNTP